MSWRIRLAAFLAAVASLVCVCAQAQNLYAAVGTAGNTGNLYLVSPANATSTPVGALVTAVGGLPVAITGLAVNPYTGVLYGVTSNGSPNIPAHLVSISTANAAVTDIGAMGTSLSDIAFSPGGVLYGVSGANANLWVVDLGTGVASIEGTAGVVTSGGGFSINQQGAAVLFPNGASGNMDAVNLNTGAVTVVVAAMTGAPLPGNGLNSASFNAAGQIFAVNGNGAPSHLVTVNTTTGAVTDVGVLPDNIDALAFAVSISNVPTMSEWSMIVMALLLAITGFVAMRRSAR